jgi:hypothetical protein
MKDGDDDHLYNEEGKKRRLNTHDYVFPYGKYKGYSLYELDDVGYLQWAKKQNDADLRGPDWFFDKIVTMRLKELQ